MKKGDDNTTTPREDLPGDFESVGEAGAFWDDHDSTEYENMMENVDFEVDIKRRVYLVPVAGQILQALRKRAKSEGLSTETLVNLLLRDHVG